MKLVKTNCCIALSTAERFEWVNDIKFMYLLVYMHINIIDVGEITPGVYMNPAQNAYPHCIHRNKNMTFKTVFFFY